LAQQTRWWGAVAILCVMTSLCAASGCDSAIPVSPDEAAVARELAALFTLSGVGEPAGQPGFTVTLLDPVWIPRRAYVLDIRIQRSRSVASLQSVVALLIAKTGPEIAGLLGEQRLAVVIKTGLYGTPHGYYLLGPDDLRAGTLPAYTAYTVDEREVVAWLQEFRKFLAEIAPLEPSSAREEYVPGVGACLALAPDVLSSSAARDLGTCSAWMDLLLDGVALGVGQIVAERMRSGEVLVVETLLATYANARFVVPAGEYSDVAGWEIYLDE